MDKWSIFKNSINDLVKPNQKIYDIENKWSTIERDFKNFIPNHLSNFLNILRENKLNSKSKILDHGCGSGLTLFFLASKGYKNIWGIDINNSSSFNARKRACNDIFRIIFIVR